VSQGTNIEQIVAVLLAEGLLGGFHFNNRKYADDDLIVGSVDPFELVRIMREYADAPSLEGISVVDLGSGYGAIAEHVTQELGALGFVTAQHELPDDVFEARLRRDRPELEGPRPNVVGRRAVPTDTPRVAFYCHLDTVPVVVTAAANLGQVPTGS
jgi:acetylornithine deacetylase/succinyl-diaminopimelate desuccinylase-like protein